MFLNFIEQRKLYAMLLKINKYYKYQRSTFSIVIVLFIKIIFNFSIFKTIKIVR